MSGELPSGWGWAQLGTIAETQLGKMLSGKSRLGLRPHPYLRNRNVQWHSFDLTDVAQMDFSESELHKYELRPGDLLVCEGGEVGRCAVWSRSAGDMCFQKALHRVRPLAGVQIKWIEYFLRWSAETGRFGNSTQGSTIAHLPQRDLRMLQVPVAPSAEQERIVEAVEEHFSRLSAVEATAVGARRRLSVLRNVIMDRTFYTDAKPMHTAEIGDLAEVSGGIQKQPKRRPRENRYPFLRVANVGRGHLDLADVHEIELFEGEIDRFRLRKGDLLVVEGNGSVNQIGRAALWSGQIEDCVHQNHLIRVRPGEGLLPEYLALCWNAPRTAQQIQAVTSSTSGLYTLSTRKVKSIRIPVVPLSVQRRVVEQLDQHLRSIEIANSEAEAANSHLSALRRAVLAQAFTGQLIPQDPDDEPASALLERIADSQQSALG